jgi:hypothetical protein
MNTSRSVTILFLMITFFAGCSNDAGNSQAGKQETPQTTFAKNPVKEEKVLISEERQLPKQDLVKVTNLNNKSLVGTWKSRTRSSGYYTSFVYTYDEFGTCYFKSYGKHTAPSSESKYEYSNNRLVIRRENGDESICSVEWIDTKSVILTQLNGRMRGSKYYYKLASSIDSDTEIPLSTWYDNGEKVTDSGGSGGGSTSCIVCDGRGKVKYQPGSDDSCLTPNEIRDAIIAGVNGDPDIEVTVWVRCCSCSQK